MQTILAVLFAATAFLLMSSTSMSQTTFPTPEDRLYNTSCNPHRPIVILPPKMDTVETRLRIYAKDPSVCSQWLWLPPAVEEDPILGACMQFRLLRDGSEKCVVALL